VRFIDRPFTHPQALALMIAAAVLNSFSALSVKYVNLDASTILGLRSAIAICVMLAFTGKPKFSGSKAQTAGAFSYALTIIFFIEAVKLTTAANAALLLNTAPVYVALLGAWLLHERTTKSDWLVLFLVMAGMVLFFFDRLSSAGMTGNILAMLSGLCLALTGIAMRFQKDGSPLETFVLGHVLIILFSLPSLFHFPAITQSVAVNLLLMGVLQSAMADIFYSVSIKNVSALESKLIYNIRPILASLWVFICLGEKPGHWAICGGAIVLGAITAKAIFSLRKKPIETDGSLQRGRSQVLN